MTKMNLTILKQIDDVDFGIIDEVKDDRIKLKTVHGNVLIVVGLVEDEPEEITTIGIVNGEKFARMAFYKPMNEIEQMLRGKNDGSEHN